VFSVPRRPATTSALSASNHNVTILVWKDSLGDEHVSEALKDSRVTAIHTILASEKLTAVRFEPE
jgi:hypothetical protein